MTRAQRRAHLALWIVLGPLVLLALAWAFVDRSVVPASETPGIEARR